LSIDAAAWSGHYAAMSKDGPVSESPRALAVRPTAVLREQAIERLSSAFAGGAIDTDELERRVTIAHRSQSASEIELLLADLPVTPTVPSSHQTALVPATSAQAVVRTSIVFGSTRRSGAWAVPRRLAVRAVFGNVELDFRHAVLPAAAVDLDVSAVFGNIEITVPPHLAVESNGSAVLGNFDHVDRAPADLAPDAPVLRIHGTSVFGNVEIVMRLANDEGRPRLPPK
jgi:hypothetical protein